MLPSQLARCSSFSLHPNSTPASRDRVDNNWLIVAAIGRRQAVVDGKMFLYLAGAVLLQLHVLSAAALQAGGWAKAGGGNGLPVSTAMAVYLGCFSWFLCEYLLFEDIHTYTCARPDCKHPPASHHVHKPMHTARFQNASSNLHPPCAPSSLPSSFPKP